MVPPSSARLVWRGEGSLSTPALPAWPKAGGRMAVLDRTVGAEEFAHSEEHELLGDLPWGIQLGQELG